eukprot:scaffold15908_cov132-Cylindrotheca_fusiformis.AAC.3
MMGTVVGDSIVDKDATTTPVSSVAVVNDTGISSSSEKSLKNYDADVTENEEFSSEMLVSSSQISLDSIRFMGAGEKKNHNNNNDSSSSSSPRSSSLLVKKKNRKSADELKLVSTNTITSSVVRDSMLSELTINKINIKEMGLIGREHEMEILKSCYHRIVLYDEETEVAAAATDGEENGRERRNAPSPLSQQSNNVSSSRQQQQESRMAVHQSNAMVHHQKELVFIQGYSGVGKTSLAKTLEKETTTTKKKNNKQTGAGRTGAIYVEGKATNSNEPYSGIASVFGQICNQISKNTTTTTTTTIRQDEESSKKDNVRNHDDHDHSMMLRFGSRLSAALGPATKILSDLIPELEDLLKATTTRQRQSSSSSSSGGNTSSHHHHHHHQSDDVENQSDFDAAQKQAKYAFRVLMRELNAVFSPIVIVLDDLQWADESSLKVMDFLISDVQNLNGLMIVGCYRSNEVDDQSLLLKSIRSMRKKQERFHFRVSDIAVESCDIDSVNKMIMAMMSIDDENRTRGLAEVCYKRTGGNPFFLIEFMVMLQDEKLISYNLGLLKWIWDEKEIAEATMSTDNVVDLLQSRMRKMPANVQLLLQYAACLGSTFSASTLDLIWREQSIMGTDYTPDTITGLLEGVVSSNLVEACGGKNNEYRWVHDKVQEAALSLSDIVSPEFQFEIGAALYHSLDGNALDEQIFVVVDLLNKGLVRKRKEFAKLNLRAAEKAKKISAFHSAATYAAKGIELLPSDKWTTHRALTLALYTIGSEVELALGHSETAEIYSNEVLSRKECTLREALPLKMAKSLKLCTVDMKYKEAVEINLGLLKDLGVKLLWTRATTPLQCIRTLIRTIKTAKKAPAPEVVLEKLGRMRDPKHRVIILLLSRLCYACFWSEDHFLHILCICKIVEMTLQYGVCEASPSGFSSLGQMTVILRQDYRAAASFADLALAIQKVFRPSRESETIFLTHAFCLPWTRPLQQFLAPAAEGYALGMRTGDTLFAMWNLPLRHIWLPYALGKPLGPMLEQCPKILSQMEELSQAEQIIPLRMFWQTVLNLVTTPVSKNVDKLEGDIFSSEGFTSKAAVNVGTIHFWQGELLVYYDLEAAAKRAIKDGEKFANLCPGSFISLQEVFHRAIAVFAMAQRTKKRKYRTYANKLANRIDGWVRSGNPNVRHYHLALMAEQAALSKKYDLAEERYKSAISLSARTGHLNDVALINERYAEFLQKELSDERESKYRLGEAIRFYEAWGAFGKAETLQKQL